MAKLKPGEAGMLVEVNSLSFIYGNSRYLRCTGPSICRENRVSFDTWNYSTLENRLKHVKAKDREHNIPWLS